MDESKIPPVTFVTAHFLEKKPSEAKTRKALKFKCVAKNDILLY